MAKKRASSSKKAPVIHSIRVGVCAPSSYVSQTDLKKGVDYLGLSFDVTVHPQCKARDLYLAGDDEARARALWEMACDPGVDVLWAARGGYGAARLLPLLDAYWEAGARSGAPRPLPGKLFVGYSDSTALLEYVRVKWGWSGLHAEMPGLSKFFAQTPADMRALVDWVSGEQTAAPWERKALSVWRPGAGVEAEITGGNLSVFASLIGTPHALKVADKILFIEEVDEALYRVDRLVQQCLASGAWKGARALVLGGMDGCVDRVPMVGQGAKKKPLRPLVPAEKGLRAIFERAGEQLGIPVVAGLPIGHGPGHSPLPIGARGRLSLDAQKAKLELLSWSGWRQ